MEHVPELPPLPPPPAPPAQQQAVQAQVHQPEDAAAADARKAAVIARLALPRPPPPASRANSNVYPAVASTSAQAAAPAVAQVSVGQIRQVFSENKTGEQRKLERLKEELIRNMTEEGYEEEDMEDEVAAAMSRAAPKIKPHAEAAENLRLATRTAQSALNGITARIDLIETTTQDLAARKAAAAQIIHLFPDLNTALDLVRTRAKITADLWYRVYADDPAAAKAEKLLDDVQVARQRFDTAREAAGIPDPNATVPASVAAAGAPVQVQLQPQRKLASEANIEYVEKFSGEGEDKHVIPAYKKWVNQWTRAQENLENICIGCTPDLLLTRMKSRLSGVALEQVATVDEGRPDLALKNLARKFNEPTKLVSAYMDDIRTPKYGKSEDIVRDLRDSVGRVGELLSTLEEQEIVPTHLFIFNAAYQALEEKGRATWSAMVKRKEKEYLEANPEKTSFPLGAVYNTETYLDFYENWRLTNPIEKEEDAMERAESASAHLSTGASTSTNTSSQSYANKVDTKKCPLHNSNSHGLFDCSQAAKMDWKEWLQHCKGWRICSRCGIPAKGDWLKHKEICKAKCTKCYGKHMTFRHDAETANNNSNSGGNNSSGRNRNNDRKRQRDADEMPSGKTMKAMMKMFQQASNIVNTVPQYQQAPVVLPPPPLPQAQQLPQAAAMLQQLQQRSQLRRRKAEREKQRNRRIKIMIMKRKLSVKCEKTKMPELRLKKKVSAIKMCRIFARKYFLIVLKRLFWLALEKA